MESEKIDDSQMKHLLIEALDFNAKLITVCTAWFGKTQDRKSSERFIREYKKLHNESVDRRKEILGIKDEDQDV